MESTYDRDLSGNGHIRRQRRVKSELQNLMADVEELVKRVANVSDAEIARVRERVERTLASVKASAAEGASAARAYAQNASAATDDYVHERPWTAVGLAAAVGVLIGFFASRR
jgi:ElaB/YqjD/DUF883 family membrane-anchored ribosome-binding protein